MRGDGTGTGLRGSQGSAPKRRQQRPCLRKCTSYFIFRSRCAGHSQHRGHVCHQSKPPSGGHSIGSQYRDGQLSMPHEIQRCLAKRANRLNRSRAKGQHQACQGPLNFTFSKYTTIAVVQLARLAGVCLGFRVWSNIARGLVKCFSLCRECNRSDYFVVVGRLGPRPHRGSAVVHSS